MLLHGATVTATVVHNRHGLTVHWLNNLIATNGRGVLIPVHTALRGQSLVRMDVGMRIETSEGPSAILSSHIQHRESTQRKTETALPNENAHPKTNRTTSECVRSPTKNLSRNQSTESQKGTEDAIQAQPHTRFTTKASPTPKSAPSVPPTSALPPHSSPPSRQPQSLPRSHHRC